MLCERQTHAVPGYDAPRSVGSGRTQQTRLHERGLPDARVCRINIRVHATLWSMARETATASSFIGTLSAGALVVSVP